MLVALDSTRTGLAPSARAVSAEFQADLRTILPTACLYHVIDGKWWLLDYKPHRIRRTAGAASLERGSLNWITQKAKHATAAGFVKIGEYEFQGEPWREYLKDELRVKVAATIKQLDEVFRKLEAASDGTDHEQRSMATMRDFVHSEKKTMWNRMRGNRTFAVPHSLTRA